jgi:hypothetical protein
MNVSPFFEGWRVGFLTVGGAERFARGAATKLGRLSVFPPPCFTRGPLEERMVSYGKRFRKKGPEETVFGAGVTSERDEKKITHDERGDVFMMKEARRFLGSE